MISLFRHQQNKLSVQDTRTRSTCPPTNNSIEWDSSYPLQMRNFHWRSGLALAGCIWRKTVCTCNVFSAKLQCLSLAVSWVSWKGAFVTDSHVVPNASRMFENGCVQMIRHPKVASWFWTCILIIILVSESGKLIPSVSAGCGLIWLLIALRAQRFHKALRLNRAGKRVIEKPQSDVWYFQQLNLQIPHSQKRDRHQQVHFKCGELWMESLRATSVLEVLRVPRKNIA